MSIIISGPKILPLCSTCLKAKQVSQPFSPAARWKTPGHCLHLDIAGGGSTLDTENPLPTYGSRRYYLLVTDDVTRFRWIFLLARKSDASESIKYLIQHLRNLGFLVARVHCDGAREFIGNGLDKVYLDNCIQYAPTPAHTSQSNGPSERAIRLVGDRYRSLLFDANFRLELWGEASLTSVSILNLIPSSVPLYGVIPNPQSSFEAFFGIHPSLSCK